MESALMCHAEVLMPKDRNCEQFNSLPHLEICYWGNLCGMFAFHSYILLPNTIKKFRIWILLILETPGS